MSGTFEELTVPPTLVAFGVTTADSRKVLFLLSSRLLVKTSTTSQVKLFLQEIDFDLIKSNFAKFEGVQS